MGRLHLILLVYTAIVGIKLAKTQLMLTRDKYAWVKGGGSRQCTGLKRFRYLDECLAIY